VCCKPSSVSQDLAVQRLVRQDLPEEPDLKESQRLFILFQLLGKRSKVVSWYPAMVFLPFSDEAAAGLAALAEMAPEERRKNVGEERGRAAPAEDAGAVAAAVPAGCADSTSSTSLASSGEGAVSVRCRPPWWSVQI